MLSESLSGISTIRANNALDYFKITFRDVHDAHGRSCYDTRYTLLVIQSDSQRPFLLQGGYSLHLFHAVDGLAFVWMLSCSVFLQ